MEPQRLPGRRGWEWIKRGYGLFMKSPLIWIVLLSLCVVAAVAVSSFPVLGEPLVSLLMPVVLAGLMAGCRSLEQGEELELAHLFSGFRRHTTQLVALGGMALVGQYLILGAMMMVGGATLVGVLTNPQPDADPNVMMQSLAGSGFALLLGIVLFSLLMMAMQFAPILVYFNGVAPLQAMKLSLRAFLHNIWPMLVYGITFTLLGILASLPMMLGWLVLLPLAFTSLYACYADIFPAEAQKLPDTAAGEISAPGKDLP